MKIDSMPVVCMRDIWDKCCDPISDSIAWTTKFRVLCFSSGEIGSERFRAWGLRLRFSTLGMRDLVSGSVALRLGIQESRALKFASLGTRLHEVFKQHFQMGFSGV